MKVIKRLFNAGKTGFKGGLSADNYIKIAKTSASTATRDLKDLVKKQYLLGQEHLKAQDIHLILNLINAYRLIKPT